MTPRNRVRVAAAAVCLAASVPYARSISYYFVQDDFGVVQLLARKPWSTFPRWFVMPWMEDIWGYTPDEIRPFPALSYQLTGLWGASAPEGHHLLNIALHAANALLVMSIARAAAGLPLRAAALAAAIFALLPVASESVAWITGRVDTMPALFYLASFLAYVKWRSRPAPRAMAESGARAGIGRDTPRLERRGDQSGSLRVQAWRDPGVRSEPHGTWYGWSLLWYFLALFSKQNTITLPAALIAYDLLVAGRPARASWRWFRAYAPFVAMTCVFLALRFAVLGEALRESQLTSDRILTFGQVASRHLQRILFGHTQAVGVAEAAFAAACAAAAGIAMAAAGTAGRTRALRLLLFFGPVWLALGLAPALAAGYESPRHAYLAASGWAVACGLAFDLLWRALGGQHPRTRLWIAVVLLTATLVLGGYAWRLHESVSDWGRRAAVSRAAAEELERHVMQAAPGTLVLVGVPVESWEWAAPFVARAPFAATDLTRRALIVTPRLLDCCRGLHWESRTRALLQEWSAQSDRAVVALHVGSDGEVRRLTGADEELLAAAAVLQTIPSADSLDGALVDILRELVAGRGEVVRPAWRRRNQSAGARRLTARAAASASSSARVTQKPVS